MLNLPTDRAWTDRARKLAAFKRRWRSKEEREARELLRAFADEIDALRARPAVRVLPDPQVELPGLVSR